jgi:NAD(P)-dependent dehydrogenase (short-subunit alcohol dehydrogenase family)
MRLAGKTAIITGGASGIGRCTALRMIDEGAAVAIVDRDAAGIERVIAERPMAYGITADVADEEACAAGVAAVAGRFGPVNTLVTCAGFSITKTLEDTDPREWDDVFRTNVVGTYLWMRAVLPAMPRGGSVTAVSSQLAVAGGTTNTAYIASKGAIISLARSTALDVAARGIRVNVVLPGAIETPAFQRNLSRRPDPAAARAEFVRRHPLGRVGRPEEVADAIVYLASDEASFTTGAMLPVDGGWLAG